MFCYTVTTWLDPTLAVEQARAVAAALTRLRPQHEAEFAERMAALERDWVELDLRLAAAAERIADTPLLFSHPVYQYLERRYELDGRSLNPRRRLTGHPSEEYAVTNLRTSCGLTLRTRRMESIISAIRAEIVPCICGKDRGGLP